MDSKLLHPFCIFAIFAALALGACGPEGSTTAEPVGKTSSALNAAPKLGDFAIYAERSVTVGPSNRVIGGDIGVRTTAPSSFGPQVKIGAGTTVDWTHNILAPSVSLTNAIVGDIQRNSQTNTGTVVYGRTGPFPATAMPAMRVATAAVPGGANVTVPAATIQAIAPGNYGALNVTGTLQLSAGTYSFTSVNLATFACFAGQTGPITVNVSGTFTGGQGVTILPPLTQAASQLTINVAGADTSPTAPAVLIGANSTIIALLAAPNGTVSLDNGVFASGAFGGYDVALGNNVTLIYQNGLVATDSTQQGSQALSGYFTPEIANSPVVGPVPPSTVMNMSLGLPSQNLTDLQDTAAGVSDPTKPTFRQFVAPDNFAARFGAAGNNYPMLQAWATSNGLTVTKTYANTLLFDVSGPASAFAQALFVNLEYRLRADGTQFYAPDRDPSVATTVPVLAIDGLSNFAPAQRFFGSGPSASLEGIDFRQLYLANCQNLTGAGQAIGLAEIGPLDPNDIAAYETQAGLSAIQSQPVPIHALSLDGVSTTGTPDTEATLDAEMAISMAPGLGDLMLFEGNTLTSIFGAMATTKSTVTGDVARQLSSSVFPPLGSKTFPVATAPMVVQLLLQFEVQGQSFDLSSGDSGGFSNAEVLSDADGITVVGGTEFDFSGTNEGTWPGSGGGTASPGFSLPFYQKGIAMTQNHGSTTVRNLPDVAMVAVNIAELIQGQNTAQNITGGTSVSAPLWGGFVALVNQQNQLNHLPYVGFANPALYAIAKSPVYALAFNDIKDGAFTDNMSGAGPKGFPSVPGYDLATGWGSPKCNLINQLTHFTTNTGLGAGLGSTCAVRPDGSVWCAGDMGGGELGNGSTTGSEVPVRVSGVTNASAVSVGGAHACVLLTTGGIDCWGDDVVGELGNGTTSFTSIPTPVAVQGLPGTAVAIGTGFEVSCALMSAGTVACWGDNSLGTLGLGNDISESTPTVIPNLSGVVSIGVGSLHACALLRTGTVECWGENFEGALGDGTTTQRDSPVAVQNLSGATALALGDDHACAIVANGAIECWGDNDFGQLGDGTTTERHTPVFVSGVTGATAIAGGDEYTCAILAGGAVSCWGSSVGVAGDNGVDQHTPLAVPGVTQAVAIAAGAGQTCALLSGGSVVCWGYNIEGQLGDGTRVSHDLPETTMF